MKILAIGNSFSEDATTYLHQIGEAAGVKNQIVNLYIGGCPLETHWENIESGARKYLFQMNGKKPDYAVSIPQVLEMTEWDVIITQQASHDSGWIESYEPFLGKMLDYIREKQPNARLMLQETWAYASDSVHPKFVRYNHSQKEMFERLYNAYHTMADRYKLPLIRSGELVQALRATEMFDEDIGRHAICRDGFHMSLIYGRYALGCLWAKMLWGITLKDNAFVPSQRIADLEEYFPLGEVDMEALQLIRNMVDAM